MQRISSTDLPSYSPTGHAAAANRKMLLLACIAANCFANVPLWLLPEILSSSITALSLTAVQSSALVSGENLALALTAILLSSRDFKFSYRSLAFAGALIALAGNLAATYSTGFAGLFAARTTAGIGEGAVLMVATTLAASFNHPDRAYAQLNLANIIYGSLVFFGLPFAVPHREGLVIFQIIAVAMLPFVVPLFWLSSKAVHRSSFEEKGLLASPGASRTFSPPALLLYVAMLLLGTAGGGTWAFLVEFGKLTGLPHDKIDWAIGVATIGAAVASGSVAVLRDRVGRLGPVLAVTLLAMIASYVVSHDPDPLAYRVTAVLLLFCMFFLLPYYLAYGVALDKSGRISSIVNATFMFTSGCAGPLVAGIVADSIGMHAVGTTSAVLSALSLLLIAGVNRRVAGLQRTSST